MDPAAHHHGQLVVGGGLVTADPGIDLGRESWLHNVFQCPLHKDFCVPATDFVRTTELVQLGIKVPGSAARPCLLRLLRQCYGVMWGVRRAGFTFRGNFNRKNYVVYQPQQKSRKRKRGSAAERRRAAEDGLEVRMTGRLHLSQYSPEDAVQDDRTFVLCMRELLFINRPEQVPNEIDHWQVPKEIDHWLDLINGLGVGNEYLIRYHPRAAFSVLMFFRRRLDFLMRRRPEVYATIVNMMGMFQGWNSCVLQFKNRLMEAARLHILNQSGRSQEDGFDPNVRGILKVIRDYSEHPARRFEIFMLLILEEDFRAFAALLQFVMFRTSIWKPPWGASRVV